MNYRVHLHNKPSPSQTFYEGYLDVSAEDEEHAVDVALRLLKRGSFKDRASSDWRVEHVEELGE